MVVRHGIFGVERKVIINTLFKHLIDAVLPNPAKFLLHASTREEQELKSKMKKYSKYQLSEHFNQSDMNSWEEVLGILNTTAE